MMGDAGETLDTVENAGNAGIGLRHSRMQVIVRVGYIE